MGLGSYWGEVIDVLREIIPVYDKVNSFISLGKDVEHRNRAIRGRVKKGDKILDAGSGFGNMSKTAAKIVDDDLKIILYDPLVPMLKNTDRLFDKKLDSACGVFEHVPFQDKEFDAVLSGYSLRDAISLKTAISEMHRILKEDGKWVIVDLGKPDEPFFRTLCISEIAVFKLIASRNEYPDNTASNSLSWNGTCSKTPQAESNFLSNSLSVFFNIGTSGS